MTSFIDAFHLTNFCKNINKETIFFLIWYNNNNNDDDDNEENGMKWDVYRKWHGSKVSTKLTYIYIE